MKFYQDLFSKSLCLALLWFVSSLAAAKPLSPIHITIEPVQPIVPGQPAEFVVRAFVSVDAENLRIIVSLPPLVKITSGERKWQGPLQKGEEKQLRFTAVAVGSANKVLEAQAFISAESISSNSDTSTAGQGGHAARFSASAAYLWKSGAANAASTQVAPLGQHENPRIVPGHGRNIAEYPLRP